MSSEEAGPSRSWKAPEVLVPFLGLLYSGLYLITVVVPILTAGGASSPAVLILVPFIIIFLALSFGVWKQNRYAYVGSVALSLVFLFLEGTFAGDTLASPADYITFFGVVTVIVSLIATLVYSVMGVRTFWRKSTTAPMRRSMPSSGALAIFAVGFIVGALLIGALAGATEARLLKGAIGDIAIVSGASNPSASQFYNPSPFTVAAGHDVTWVNRDGTAHTVTSDTAGLFDSGSMAPGGTWTNHFTTPGTYTYYCAFHTFMKGTIVVSP